MKNANRLMRRLIADLRDTCTRPELDDRSELTRAIEDNLRSTHAASTARATLNLDGLGHWYALRGAMAVIEGDPVGWSHIDRSLHYRWWNTRISTPGVFVKSAACTLAHCIAFDECSMARWLAERMAASLDDHVFQTWRFSSFGAFLLMLWGTYTGNTVTVERPDVARLGVYQRAFDTWSDDEGFRGVVEGMCDYHLKESTDSGGEPQFTEAAYDVFPVDILALEAIRRRMGLSTPRPDHPLLATPLANPPPPDQRPRMGPDPLLEAVIKKARDTGFLPPEETGV